MLELFAEQGSRSLGMKLLEHVRNVHSQAGVQMTIPLDWFQMTAGVSFLILEEQKKRTPHLHARTTKSNHKHSSEWKLLRIQGLCGVSRKPWEADLLEDIREAT